MNGDAARSSAQYLKEHLEQILVATSGTRSAPGYAKRLSPNPDEKPR